MSRRIKELFRTTVVCIRHAESETNASLSTEFDSKLTENGVKQAQKTAEHLQEPLVNASNGYVLAYCSPLLRTQRTMDEFCRHDHQPLKLKKRPNILDCMHEYRKEVHGNVEKFVDQTFELFYFLQRKADVAVEEQTIVLFGHSLLFSTLFTIIANYHPEITKDEHKKRVLDRVVSKHDPCYLITVYQLPNCSISVACIDQSVSNKELAWNILSIGKCDHLLKHSMCSGHWSQF